MIKFKKGYNVKIIVLAVVVSFFLNNTIYGMDVSLSKTLRPPLVTNSQEGIKRLETAKELQIQRAGFLKKLFRLIFYGYPLLPEQSKIAADVILAYQGAFKLDIIKKDEDVEGYVRSKIFRLPYSFSWPMAGLLTFNLYSGIVGIYCGYLNSNGKIFFEGLLFVLGSYVISVYFLSFITANCDLIFNIIELRSRAANLIGIRFIYIIAHELAHLCRLPNNSLLANAYAIGILGRARFGKLIEQIENIGETEKIENIGNLNLGAEEIDSNVKFLILADVSIQLISDSVRREVAIRKILSKGSYLEEFEKCDTKQQIKELLTVVSNGLIDKDYRIPHIYLELFHYWAYHYGFVMGYIAIKIYSDAGLQYIYRLGQARDSRELEGFEPEGAPAEELQPLVYPPQSVIDSVTRQPDMAI